MRVDRRATYSRSSGKRGYAISSCTLVDPLKKGHCNRISSNVPSMLKGLYHVRHLSAHWTKPSPLPSWCITEKCQAFRNKRFLSWYSVGLVGTTAKSFERKILDVEGVKKAAWARLLSRPWRPGWIEASVRQNGWKSFKSRAQRRSLADVEQQCDWGQIDEEERSRSKRELVRPNSSRQEREI